MKILKSLICAVAVVSFAGAALANSYTFTTPGGSVDSAGDPVNASASFTTGNGTLSISLSNLLVNQKDVGQNISDLFFTLSSNSTSGTIGTDGPDPLVNVDASGNASSGGTGAAGWNLTFNAVTGFHLDGLNGATSTPAHTILGAPGPGGTYSNANGSIAGNSPHNPFINQTATWTLNIAGVSSTTAVTSATFSFGTTSGNNVPGTPNIPNVPDGGSTLTLLGAALGGLGLVRRFVRR